MPRHTWRLDVSEVVVATTFKQRPVIYIKNQYILLLFLNRFLLRFGVVFGVVFGGLVVVFCHFFIGAHMTNRQARHKNILHDNAAPVD